jgi:hypothetical protein
VGLSLTFAAFLWATPPDPGVRPAAPSAPGEPPRSDVQLYIRTVEDIRQGRGYYEAAGDEMRAGGYPTRSVFNWRQPLMYLALSYAPQLLAQLWLAVLAAKLLWDTGKTLPRETFALVPMVNSCIGLLVPVAIYLTEAWAGACIALSLLSYARSRERAGAVWGLAALFVRELAGPYCLFAGCLALWRRRWDEVRVWAIGGAIFAAYYGLHAMQVLKNIRPEDRAHLKSWVAFGGLPFLAETLKTNGLLLQAPRFVVAIVAVALVAAWWDRRLPIHARATLIMYGVLFLVVGLPFNGYWGLLIAPTVSLWLAYSWGGLRTLWDPASVTSNARPARPRLAPHA